MSGDDGRPKYTTSNAEGGAKSGWSIRNNSWDKTGFSWTSEQYALQIRVKGTIDEADSDASLSALILTDASSNSIALSPGFIGNTLEYTASVANSVDPVTLAAIATSDGATVAITGDTDATTPGEATLDLAEGANTLTVTVTAEDTTTMRTYTVDVFHTVSAPTPDPDAIWTANLTVGSNFDGGFLGYSHIDAGAAYGALTPRQFDHNSEDISVRYLASQPAGNGLYFWWSGDLGSSNYTLQLDDVHVAVLAAGNNGSLTIITSDIDWAVNEIVTVKLFEGLVGVSVSDDATLSSLDFVLENSVANDKFLLSEFLTPAFDPAIRSYSAVVPVGVDVFAESDDVVPAAGATVKLTVNGSDFTNDLNANNDIPLQIGNNELRFTVTAQDTVTKQVYVVKLTRGDPEPLKAWLAVPESHDGSTPFTVTLGFLDEDISLPLSQVAAVVVVTNGTKGAVTADGGSQHRFLIPVTPTSSQPVRIQVRGAQHCGESHAICAEEIGRVFQMDISRWVGAADDARLRQLWLVTAVGGGTTKTPAFHHDTANYLTVVDFSYSELTLHAAPYASGATIRITGPAGTYTVSDRWDGGKTAKLDVPVGSTTWTVTVTSDDGNETMSYGMTVKRNPRPPLPSCYGEVMGPGGITEHSALGTLTVTPVGGGTLVSGPSKFSHANRRSTVHVNNDTTHVNVRATGATAGSTVEILTGRRTPLTQPMELVPAYRYFTVQYVSLKVRAEVDDKCYISYYGVKIVKLPLGQTALATGVGPLVGSVQDAPSSHDGSSASAS